MQTKIALIIILTILSIGPTAHGKRCDLSLTPNLPPHIHRLLEPLSVEKKMEPVSVAEFSEPRISLINGSFRAHSVSTTSFRFLEVIEYTYEHFKVIIKRPRVSQKREIYEESFRTEKEAHSYLEKNGLDGENLSVFDLGLGRSRIFETIIENLSFVLKEYVERKGWPPQFLKDLVQVAFQYASYSTYIEVRTLEGDIIGSGRLVSVPYLKHEKPENQSHDAYQSELALRLAEDQKAFAKRIHADIQTDPLFSNNRDVWTEVFKDGLLEFNKEELSIPDIQFDKDMAFIPTPMENVLQRNFPEYRGEPNHRRKYFMEPGNFAAIKDSELPDALKRVAAPAIYFHAARLIREPKSDGVTEGVGTYAGDKGASDKYYQFLGFEKSKSLNPSKDKTPTDETWNVLVGDGQLLNSMLIKRLGFGPLKEKMQEIFSRFNEGEADSKSDISIQNIFGDIAL